MNRTLTALLAAAAVVGAAGGTVAATALGDDETPPTASEAPSATDGPIRSDGSSPPSESSGAATRGPGEVGDVLWGNQRELHDGEQVVEYQLLDPPASIERAAVGWVVTTGTSPQEPSFEASVVRPDGSVIFLASTFGDGDVSPDGTRYVAMRGNGTGYGVWDVETGELVGVVDRGTDDAQYTVGGAQFVDDDTVATTWTVNNTRRQIVASDLDDVTVDGLTADPAALSDDVVGAWRISPDGRFLAGTSRTARDAETAFEECTEIIDLNRVVPRNRDCGSRFDRRPTFSTDSTEALAIPFDSDGFGPGAFRALSLEGFGGEAGQRGLEAPEATLAGVYLDADRVMLLRAQDDDGAGTIVDVCDIDTDTCESVAEVGDAASTAVLGSSD